MHIRLYDSCGTDLRRSIADNIHAIGVVKTVYGYQARIQEFSSGGSNFPKILTSKKKKKKKKKKKNQRNEKTGFRLFFPSFPSAEVWLKSTFQKIIYIQIYFR